MRSTLREVVSAGNRIAGRMSVASVGHSYTWDLALEALLRFSAVTGQPRWRAVVEQDIARRGWTSQTRISWRHEPFCSLSWAWAKDTGDADLRANVIAETQAMIRDLPRTVEGLVTHPRGPSRGGGEAVLLDSFQEYISRVARAGAVLGSQAMYRDCAEQVVLHQAVLRDPASGLWCQGRGWLADPSQHSPGTWSRGQGWLLRGLVSATEALPPEHATHGIVNYALAVSAEAICARQQPSGLWHALPHRPPEQSPPETSGTALIAAGLLRAIHAGLLPAEPYREHAWRAVVGLLGYISHEGVVESTCPGPGPIQSEEPWATAHFPPGDPHGVGTTLEALSAAITDALSSGCEL